MAWTTPRTWTYGELVDPTKLNVHVRDNLNWIYGGVQRLSQVTRTSDYTVNATTGSGAANIFSSNLTWTADGSSSYVFTFSSPSFQGGVASANATFAYLIVWDVTANAQVGSSVWTLSRCTSAGEAPGPTYVQQVITPTAGVKTWNVRCYYYNFGGAGAVTIFPIFQVGTGDLWANSAFAAIYAGGVT